MRTSEVLRAAKGLIDSPEKWCGTGWGEGGSRCVMHAMRTVPVMHPLKTDEFMAHPAWQALRAQVPMGYAVSLWNDNRFTTHADVMAAFDRAIAAEEAKETPTPAADETLSILAACDVVAEALTDAIMRAEPDYPRSTVREVAGIELFACAQDVARIFPPLTPEVEAAWSEAIREAMGRSA